MGRRSERRGRCRNCGPVVPPFDRSNDQRRRTLEGLAGELRAGLGRGAAFNLLAHWRQLMGPADAADLAELAARSLRLEADSMRLADRVERLALHYGPRHPRARR